MRGQAGMWAGVSRGDGWRPLRLAVWAQAPAGDGTAARQAAPHQCPGNPAARPQPPAHLQVVPAHGRAGQPARRQRRHHNGVVGVRQGGVALVQHKVGAVLQAGARDPALRWVGGLAGWYGGWVGRHVGGLQTGGRRPSGLPSPGPPPPLRLPSHASHTPGISLQRQSSELPAPAGRHPPWTGSGGRRGRGRRSRGAAPGSGATAPEAGGAGGAGRAGVAALISRLGAPAAHDSCWLRACSTSRPPAAVQQRPAPSPWPRRPRTVSSRRTAAPPPPGSGASCTARMPRA